MQKTIRADEADAIIDGALFRLELLSEFETIYKKTKYKGVALTDLGMSRFKALAEVTKKERAHARKA